MFMTNVQSVTRLARTVSYISPPNRQPK